MCLTALIAVPAAAQQLPMRHFTTADGLAHNEVHAVFQDRMGYLWVSTYEGLSRFDGYRFHTYGPDDGLPNPYIVQTLEDADGRIWATALHGGVSVLADAGRPLFYTILIDPAVPANQGPNRVNTLAIPADGTIWCVTRNGVYVGRWDDGTVRFSYEMAIRDDGGRMKSFVDSRARTWFLLDRQVGVLEQGQLTILGVAAGLGDGWTPSITEAPDSRIFVVNDNRLRVFAPSSSASGPGVFSLVDVPLVAGELPRHVLFDTRGRLWLGTTRRLLMSESGAPAALRAVTALQAEVDELFGDSEGNVWIGTGHGLYRIAADAVVHYATGRVGGLAESPSGRLYATTDTAMVEIDPDGGEIARVLSLASEVGRRVLGTRSNELWFGTRDSLYRVRGFRFAEHPPERVAGPWPRSDSWLGPSLYESPDGAVWATTPDGLLRIEPHAAGGPRVTPVARAQVPERAPVGRLAIDRSGALWAGEFSRLVRTRGEVEEVIASRHAEMMPRALFVDSRGWLWVGRRFGGIAVTRDPAADAPPFTYYSTADGLSSETIWSITEDRQGRMYFGTGRGLDRLDPAAERPAFAAAGGVREGPILACLTDGAGRIWFSTPTGVSRLDPVADPGSLHPPVYLSRIAVRDRPVPLPERGVARAPAMRLAATDNDLVIEFVAVTLGGEGRLRYQSRLRAEDDWSAPHDWRAISLARLAPGRYGFEVRAIGPSGRPGAGVAGFDFEVLPPFWQRWWFTALVLVAMAAPAYALHRARVRRILAIEGVRRQVAIDLHDDIGSGLAQIAVLGEVARQRAAPAAGEELGEITGLARGLRDSMSDIVWAVDPRKDRLTDVVHRLKQVAYNLFETEGIRVDVRCPPVAARLCGRAAAASGILGTLRRNPACRAPDSSASPAWYCCWSSSPPTPRGRSRRSTDFNPGANAVRPGTPPGRNSRIGIAHRP